MSAALARSGCAGGDPGGVSVLKIGLGPLDGGPGSGDNSDPVRPVEAGPGGANATGPLPGGSTGGCRPGAAPLRDRGGGGVTAA
jgi:hypothetical protein